MAQTTPAPNVAAFFFVSQIIDNCAFILPDNADLDLVTSKDPAGGKFRAAVTRTDGRGRKKKRSVFLISDPCLTLPEALEMLHSKSAEALYNHTTALGFDIVSGRDGKSKDKKKKNKRSWTTCDAASGSDHSNSDSESDSDSDAASTASDSDGSDGRLDCDFSDESLSDAETVSVVGDKKKKKKTKKTMKPVRAPKPPAHTLGPRPFRMGPGRAGVLPPPPGFMSGPPPYRSNCAPPPRFGPNPGGLLAPGPNTSPNSSITMPPPPPPPMASNNNVVNANMATAATLAGAPVPPGPLRGLSPPSAQVPPFPVQQIPPPAPQFPPPSPSSPSTTPSSSRSSTRDFQLLITWIGHEGTARIFSRCDPFKMSIGGAAVQYVKAHQESFGPSVPVPPPSFHMTTGPLRPVVKEVVFLGNLRYDLRSYNCDDLSRLCDAAGAKDIPLFEVTIYGRQSGPSRPPHPNGIRPPPFMGTKKGSDDDGAPGLAAEDRSPAASSILDDD